MPQQSSPLGTRAGTLSACEDDRNDRQVARDHGYSSLYHLMTRCGNEGATPESFLKVKEMIKSFREEDAAAARLAAQAGRRDSRAANVPTKEKYESPVDTSGTMTPHSNTQPSSQPRDGMTRAIANTSGDGQVDNTHGAAAHNGRWEAANETHEDARGNHEEATRTRNIDNLVYGGERLGYLAMGVAEMRWEVDEEEEEGEEEDNDCLYFEGGSYDKRSNYYWDEEDS